MNFRPIISLAALSCCLVSSGCEPQLRTAAESSDNKNEPVGPQDVELVGQLKLVAVRGGGAILPWAYFVRRSDVFLLWPMDDTQYIKMDPVVDGPGFRYGDRLLHSSSVYKIRGTLSPTRGTMFHLVSLPTRTLEIKSLECLEKGTGQCQVHFASHVRLDSYARGELDEVRTPEDLKSKTGVFVQLGTGTCSVVKHDFGSGDELVNSFKSIGSINMNEQMPWAKPSSGVRPSKEETGAGAIK